MKRWLARLVLAVFLPLAVGQAIPKAPWNHTLARDWLDGAFVLSVACLVTWARAQLELDGTEIEP